MDFRSKGRSVDAFTYKIIELGILLEVLEKFLRVSREKFGRELR